MKKLALLFSHPEVTLWAHLLPWGHFVIFHSETGSPADTVPGLERISPNLRQLEVLLRAPQLTLSCPTACIWYLTWAPVCAQHSTAPGCGHCICPVGSCCYVARAWGWGPCTQLLSDLGLATPGPGLSQTRLRSLMSLWALQQGKGRCPEVLSLVFME